MAMALTKDERLVLRYLASGRSIEEIAATLNWPLQAVRWTCTHPVIAWVLDELEAGTTPADSAWAGREVSQGRAIVVLHRQTTGPPVRAPVRCAFASPVGLPQHSDEDRPERPVLLAVDK